MKTKTNFMNWILLLLLMSINLMSAQGGTPPPGGCDETTWNGTSWDNGFPDATKTAIFNGNYSSTGNITCCSVYVYAGKNVVFNSTHILKSTNQVTIETTGNLVFEKDASLVQVNNNFTNIGTIQYHVQTQPMNRNDYNYFCSPVSGQVLNQLGVNSFAAPGFIAPTNYFYWNNSLPAAVSNIPHYYYGNWNSVPVTSTMNPAGRGYIINGPQSFDPIVRQPWDVVFEGLPNNGTISLPIQGQTYVPCQDKRVINTIGNPYPSPLDADSFLTENNGILGGALYFFTHNTFYNGSTYTANDFAVYNLLGGIGTGNFNSSILNSNRPNGKISVGQGFQVMGESNGNIVFTNDMRDESTSTIFYRNSSTVNPLIKLRIWLSIEENTPIGAPKYKETLVGYINNSGVTNGYEKSFDNVQLDNLTPPLNLYSVINSTSPCPKLAIQTRALGAAFNINDIISLGFSCQIGSYKIKSEAYDGMFTTGGQKFYLKDLVTGAVHDIQNSPYNFSVSTIQTNNITRFQIVFKTITSIINPIICNTTLTAANTTIMAVIVPQATAYTFLVTNSSGISVTFTPCCGLAGFNFTQTTYIPQTFFVHGTTYSVSISVLVGGIQYPYGPPCIITLPAPPTIKVIPSQCGSISSPILIPTVSTYVNADNLANVTGYQWSVTNLSSGMTAPVFGTILRQFRFNCTSCFPLGFVTNNSDYSVRVRGVDNKGTNYVFGDECFVRLASMRLSGQSSTNSSEKIKTYPNPFTSNFTLDLFDTNQEKVQIKVYDMIGKLIDQKEVNTKEEKSILLGEGYKTGIYNVVIQDGDEIVSQRVIKN